jgi:hypothetical protein
MIRRGWNKLKCPVVDVVSYVSDYTVQDLIVIIYILEKDYIKY